MPTPAPPPAPIAPMTFGQAIPSSSLYDNASTSHTVSSSAYSAPTPPMQQSIQQASSYASSSSSLQSAAPPLTHAPTYNLSQQPYSTHDPFASQTAEMRAQPEDPFSVFASDSSYSKHVSTYTNSSLKVVPGGSSGGGYSDAFAAIHAPMGGSMGSTLMGGSTIGSSFASSSMYSPTTPVPAPVASSNTMFDPFALTMGATSRHPGNDPRAQSSAQSDLLF
jgi:hypothetical protein